MRFCTSSVGNINNSFESFVDTFASSQELYSRVFFVGGKEAAVSSFHIFSSLVCFAYRLGLISITSSVAELSKRYV